MCMCECVCVPAFPAEKVVDRKALIYDQYMHKYLSGIYVVFILNPQEIRNWRKAFILQACRSIQ